MLKNPEGISIEERKKGADKDHQALVALLKWVARSIHQERSKII